MGFHKSSERGAAEDNQFLVEVLDYSSPPELLGRRGEEDDYVTLHPSITNQLWVPDIFVDQAVRDAVYKMCSFFRGYENSVLGVFQNNCVPYFTLNVV